MPVYGPTRPCACCQLPFRPLDLPYHDEGNRQLECTQCIEHRAKPDQKLVDHNNKLLDAYINAVERSKYLERQLDRTEAAIKPVSATASRRYRVLDSIDSLLKKRPDEDDEDFTNKLLDKVYELLGDWRADERRNRK
ncbi:hypothetical protein QBL07_017935 [Gordonia rubripertincta]|uniref:Uncharacterized protein n=1 Tax=Gordonia rubripertincta TaxID=36822 RepID=A0AAW6R2V8_GORRU|nr:hypothetical protein [Gordonia rubripertincta]MDG6779589.1 hypothetical protein [Gordonia rubripertincta]NKY62895.1 hypothetical protein [Gordonia rubripertincta]